MAGYPLLKNLCPYCFSEMGPTGSCLKCAQKSNDEEASDSLPLKTVMENRYVIGKCLGIGGFGITYLAWDLKENKKVC